MSAPNTNIERQEENHKPALLAIRGAVVFGCLMLLCAIVYAVANGTAPGERTVPGLNVVDDAPISERAATGVVTN
ncbi:MAG: hypothetical protein AAF943_14875 [Pseudomonadota bacterium]